MKAFYVLFVKYNLENLPSKNIQKKILDVANFSDSSHLNFAVLFFALNLLQHNHKFVNITLYIRIRRITHVIELIVEIKMSPKYKSFVETCGYLMLSKSNKILYLSVSFTYSD